MVYILTTSPPFSQFIVLQWKRKTRQFGNISDLATRSTFRQRFFKIHLRCVDFFYFK